MRRSEGAESDGPTVVAATRHAGMGVDAYVIAVENAEHLRKSAAGHGLLCGTCDAAELPGILAEHCLTNVHF